MAEHAAANLFVTEADRPLPAKQHRSVKPLRQPASQPGLRSTDKLATVAVLELWREDCAYREKRGA